MRVPSFSSLLVQEAPVGLCRFLRLLDHGAMSRGLHDNGPVILQTLFQESDAPCVQHVVLIPPQDQDGRLNSGQDGFQGLECLRVVPYFPVERPVGDPIRDQDFLECGGMAGFFA